jgi:hypothetical protein
MQMAQRKPYIETTDLDQVTSIIKKKTSYTPGG